MPDTKNFIEDIKYVTSALQLTGAFTREEIAQCVLKMVESGYWTEKEKK